MRGKALDEERHEDDKTDSHQQNRVPVRLKNYEINLFENT